MKHPHPWLSLSASCPLLPAEQIPPDTKEGDKLNVSTDNYKGSITVPENPNVKGPIDSITIDPPNTQSTIDSKDTVDNKEEDITKLTPEQIKNKTKALKRRFDENLVSRYKIGSK